MESHLELTAGISGKFESNSCAPCTAGYLLHVALHHAFDQEGMGSHQTLCAGAMCFSLPHAQDITTSCSP